VVVSSALASTDRDRDAISPSSFAVRVATGAASAVTVDQVNAPARQHQENFITWMGYGQLLTTSRSRG